MNRQVPTWVVVLVVVVVSLVLIVAGSVWMQTTSAAGQAQGLRKGEHVVKLHVIRVKSVIREPLYAMRDWGPGECRREGFPGMSPGRFIAMFCDANRVLPSTEVNRIEFEYVEGRS